MVGVALIPAALIGGAFAAINTATRPSVGRDPVSSQALGVLPGNAQTVALGAQSGGSSGGASTFGLSGSITVAIPDGWKVFSKGSITGGNQSQQIGDFVTLVDGGDLVTPDGDLGPVAFRARRQVKRRHALDGELQRVIGAGRLDERHTR